MRLKCTYVVKRGGHLEKFDPKKMYTSVYGSCLAGQLPENRCVTIAETVTNQIKGRIGHKEEISSEKIFKWAVKLLKKHDKEIAFLYETHRDIS